MAARITRSLFIISMLAPLCALAACSAPWSSSSAQTASVPYKNPVFRRDFPDPMVLRNGPHDYWAYGTSPTPANWMKDELGAFPILHSTDLIHWRYVADVFKSTPEWAAGDLWAPSAVRRGGTYYVYYTGLSAFSNVHCIGVATARRPAGPFFARNIVGCGDNHGIGFIDPAVYIDADGRAYLYVAVDSPKHTISVAPLKPDLLHLAGPSHRLFGVTQPWEHSPVTSTVEGPFLIRRGGLYYLFFSGNALEDRYAMGYATARSPLGPFTVYKGNPILQGTKELKAPGGGSVVRGPDERLWMVYHAWRGPESYNHHGQRELFVDPITWHGAVPSVQPTVGGKAAQ